MGLPIRVHSMSARFATSGKVGGASGSRCRPSIDENAANGGVAPPARTLQCRRSDARPKLVQGERKRPIAFLRASGEPHDCTLSCPAYVLYGLHGAFCAACRHERAKFALSIPALSGGRWQLRWALRTSRVVRWPTGASSRTPLRATSAAGPAPARPESAPVRPLERTHRALAPARPTRRSTVRCRPTLHGHHPSAWKREARHAAEAFLLQTAVQSLADDVAAGRLALAAESSGPNGLRSGCPSRSSRSLSRQEASMPQ